MQWFRFLSPLWSRCMWVSNHILVDSMTIHDYLWLCLKVDLKSNGFQIETQWFWASVDVTIGVPDLRTLWLHRGARGARGARGERVVFLRPSLCVRKLSDGDDDHLNSEPSVDQPAWNRWKFAKIGIHCRHQMHATTIVVLNRDRGFIWGFSNISAAL